MFMSSLGKFLIVVGLALVVVGAILVLNVRLPWLGHLPGDFHIKKDNFEFYFPLTTCIVISVLLTLIFSLFRK